MTSFSVQFETAAADKVRAAAEKRGMSVEQLIATAAEWFVADEDRYEADGSDRDAADFTQAQAQFARGEGVPHDAVMAAGRARLRAR